MQALEHEFAYRLCRGSVVDRRAHLAIDQNLAVARLRAQPGREIDHRPNRAVLAAALETDRTERRISVCDANPKTKLVAFPPPLLDNSDRRLRIAAAICTARTHGSGQGIGSPKITMIPSPINLSNVPSNSWTTEPRAV